MIVCVSGASGFIGRKLVEFHLNSNNEVRYLTRRDNQTIPKANVFIGDVNCHINQLLQFFNNTGTFYHCAGETNDESVMQITHVQGTSNLLNAIQQLHFKNREIFHWVQLSSCGAYGVSSFKNQPSVKINEQSPANPQNTYEITKTHADELIVEFASKNPWFKYTIIRPSIVFGLGMKSNAIKSMAKLLKLRLFISIEKDSIANYVHVDDVVSAMLLSMMNEKAFNKTFIVSSDCSMSEFIHAICKGLGIGKPLLSINISLINFFARVLDLINLGNSVRRKLEVLNRKISFSNRCIKDELGWEPGDVRAQVSEYVKSAI